MQFLPVNCRPFETNTTSGIVLSWKRFYTLVKYGEIMLILMLNIFPTAIMDEILHIGEIWRNNADLNVKHFSSCSNDILVHPYVAVVDIHDIRIK